METFHLERNLLYAGVRPWPATPRHDLDWISMSGGCYVPLGESGFQLSVIWGAGTYSSNYRASFRPPFEGFTDTPTTVEVALIDPDGELVSIDGEDVFSYVDAPSFTPLVQRAMRFVSDHNQWEGE